MHRHPSLVPLSHQHQHGLALSVLIERGLPGDPTEAKIQELRRQSLAFADVELGGHFKVEEELVFPVIRAAFGSSDLIDGLVDDHREMEALSEEIRSSSGKPLLKALATFGSLLRQHIRTEERKLFQEIQERLSEEEIQALGSRINEDLSKVCPSTQTLPWTTPASE